MININILSIIALICTLCLTFVMGKSAPEKNSDTVYYYTEDNKLVEEKIELRSALLFLYTSRLGKFLRPCFNKKYLCSLLGAYKNSWLSKHAIEPFIKKHAIDMNDFIVPEAGYTSFNDFFCRKLKPSARPLDTNPNVIVSPADCKLFIVDNISTNTVFFVKQKPFNLEKFLNSKKLAQEFEHGTLMIFRLAPYDYHRFHFPVDCIPSAPIPINGIYESVNPLVYKSGVQPLTENERHLTLLKTPYHDTIAMLSVGALFVGKIVETYTPEQAYKKGDETGYFAFGGSTIVLLFKKNTIKPLQKFLDHSHQGLETAVKMGQAITE